MKKIFLSVLLLSFGLGLTYGQYSTNRYSITDKVPKIIYKDLKDRNFPNIEVLGKQYSGESGLTLKAEIV
ncbi:hypothetical protein [Sphingobacterium kitahiroshimense]|uniref:hypothetical protein n=1 Tax=Sphingobacterium kitahiroshimense TaxID=470446 RepID=UPI002225ABC7|nr:hypothetical protein [Sphingobacterium kitahiroshimense]MCW2260327.1 hypothetical protein [Sphingobacterium kitahiroshimense]